MSLPTVHGKGFLISDGVELKFSQSGSAWARLPLSFKNSRPDGNGGWNHDKEILIDAMVFGPLAEFLSEQIAGRAEIIVSGDLYLDTYKDKQGNDRQSVKMMVQSAAPVGDRRKVAAGNVKSNDDEVPF